MVNLSAIGASDAIAIECLPDSPRVIGEPIEIGEGELEWKIVSQEKPIATPSDVARDFSETFQFDRDASSRAVAGDIENGDFVIFVKQRFNDADRSFNPVQTGLDSAEILQRNREANRAMPAHAKVTDVIKEDHSGAARWVARLAQESAHDGIGAARFVHDGRAPMIVMAAKFMESLVDSAGL